jgi:hypothetical protein
MLYNYRGKSVGLAAGYRSKFSFVFLIVFLVVACVCFYLNLTRVLTDFVYFVVLFGLVVVDVVLAYFLGKNSKKQYIG